MTELFRIFPVIAAVSKFSGWAGIAAIFSVIAMETLSPIPARFLIFGNLTMTGIYLTVGAAMLFAVSAGAGRLSDDN